ncbi:hypothetical protein [Streptomyces flavofungini]|uniref:Uncharacterized protein n=1 Tax=Streptomyces flavofungini TaxID=68200 RepID=A0ABS0X0H9_9ACTN|nr:hypothetical protein [Streptomyces flavofungini]MBJ3806679.1 hypothetical protein [Streptomyces flavofungini]GHC61282.1 hypothetical protein GCM10010349_31050 [Streptomyces flavofungini]
MAPGVPPSPPASPPSPSSQATSGWPGIDWIEDLVLHRSGPGTYARWAAGRLSWRGPEVRTAWTAWMAWARLLGERSRKSVDLSLTTSYEGTRAPDAGRPGPRGFLNSPELDSTHEHQSAFIRYVYANAKGKEGAKAGGGGGVRVDPSARFLSGPAAHDDAYEVAGEVVGDMAAVFRGGPEARELVARLSGSQARRLWHEEAEPELRPFFPGAARPAAHGPGRRRGRGGPHRRRQDALLRRLGRDAARAARRLPPRGAPLLPGPSPARLGTLLGQLDTVRAETRRRPRGERRRKPRPGRPLRAPAVG